MLKKKLATPHDGISMRLLCLFQLLNLQRNLEEKQEERDELERQVRSLKGELDSLSQAQGESGKNAVEAEKARLGLQREVDRLNEEILAMEEELQQHERDATSATTELAAKKLEFERALAAKDQEVLLSFSYHK